MSVLPSEPEFRSLLPRLGVDPADAAELVAGLPMLAEPGPAADLARHHRLLVDGMDSAQPFERWPAAADPRFYAYVFVAAVPAVRAAHAARGIPEDVSWATLADLGQQLRVHRRIYGRTGLHTQDWLTLHFRCRLVALGRLQFNLADQYHRLPGEKLFGTHIPETGPLDPAGCDASFAWAAEFFPRHFPDWPATKAVCTSWLLDPQLADYLPAGSNIMAFQRRFTRLSPGRDGDRDIVEFVFRRPDTDLTGVEPTTTLERAVVEHLAAGKQWKIVTGWLPLPVPR